MRTTEKQIALGLLLSEIKTIFFPQALIKIELYYLSDVYFVNRINKRKNGKLTGPPMETIDMRQLVS